MSRRIHNIALLISFTLALVLTTACGAPATADNSVMRVPATSITATVAAPTQAPLLQATPTRPRVYTVALPTAITPPPSAVQNYTYKVVATYPHDRAAFTEGLEIDNNALYEGTGLNGQSTLRKVDLATGNVEQSISLPAEYFGEGVTVFGDRIFQLTWQSHVGFVYDLHTFKQLTTFQYPTEGWGLTHDSTQLIKSDGTPTITFLDPQTLQVTRQITVTDGTTPVININELEYIKGAIYANIWQTDRIARIDPQTGHVTAWIDLTGLLQPADRQQPVDVLNGIAYDGANDRMYVTGKYWPKLFQIELVPSS